MSYPSVNYTFVSMTDLDATQVNTNFINILEDISSGKKDINVEDLTTNNIVSRSNLNIVGNVTCDTLNAQDSNTLTNIISTSSIHKILGSTKASITISSNAIEPSNSLIELNGEGDIADDLVTIIATNFVEGDIVFLVKKSTSGNITVKNGTGNIICGEDRVLGNNSTIIMIYGGSKFELLSYQAN